MDGLQGRDHLAEKSRRNIAKLLRTFEKVGQLRLVVHSRSHDALAQVFQGEPNETRVLIKDLLHFLPLRSADISLHCLALAVIGLGREGSLGWGGNLHHFREGYRAKTTTDTDQLRRQTYNVHGYHIIAIYTPYINC